MPTTHNVGTVRCHLLGPGVLMADNGLLCLFDKDSPMPDDDLFATWFTAEDIDDRFRLPRGTTLARVMQGWAEDDLRKPYGWGRVRDASLYPFGFPDAQRLGIASNERFTIVSLCRRLRSDYNSIKKMIWQHDSPGSIVYDYPEGTQPSVP